MKFLLSTDGNGHGTVVALRENAPAGAQTLFTAQSTHPNFSAIVEALHGEDEGVWDLFDVADGVVRSLRQISDRISYDGNNILWDGDPAHNVVADAIKRALEAGLDNYAPLARFWEKLESNPEPHSKEQAYSFLAAHQFKITEDGDVVGYKGVTDNGDGTFSSTARSQVPNAPSAYVDGVPQPPMSRVTQKIGQVVTMPRSEVEHNPALSCSRGLHVATFDYASGYGTVMEVHVNPRDICSVPDDASGEKVRVNRYAVAAVRTAEAQGVSPVVSESSWAGDVGYAG